MASIQRPTYPRPIPPDATHLTHKGKPAVRFKTEDGDTVIAPLTRDGKRCLVKLPKWYGKYVDEHGVLQRVPLSTNKTAAQQMLNELVKKVELARVGIKNDFAQQLARPLLEHLEDWQTVLLTEASAKHVKQTVACCRRLIESCGFVFHRDISESKVRVFLAGLREKKRELPPMSPPAEEDGYTRGELAAALGIGLYAVTSLVRRHRLEAAGNGKARRYPLATAEVLRRLRTKGRSVKTSNLYLDAVQAFAAWLVRDKRADSNPLANLEGGNVKEDQRHHRRALPPHELGRILIITEASPKSFRGLAGLARHALYLTAMSSGFRAEELASLTPMAFDLDAEPPVVKLAVIQSKNGEGAIQPLPPEAAAVLRVYLDGRPPSTPPSGPGRGSRRRRICSALTSTPRASPT
jgi:integrase